MTIDVFDRGRRGALRAQPWKRTNVATLRIGRLVSDVGAERDRHDDTTGTYALLDAAVAILEDAAVAASPPEPTA